MKYSPNQIILDTSEHLSNQVILSSVYSSGWNAYLDGKEETKVLETPVSLMLVNIKPETKFIEFKYQPESFEVGKYISILAIILIILTPIILKKVNKKYD